MHGLSTGPRTLAGLKAVVARNMKHGRHSGIERETAAVARQVADAVRRPHARAAACSTTDRASSRHIQRASRQVPMTIQVPMNNWLTTTIGPSTGVRNV